MDRTTLDIIHTLVGRGADCCISSDLKMSRSHRYDKKSVYTLAYAIREKSEKNNDSRRKSEKALAYREEKAPSKPRPRLRTPSERSLVMAVRKPSDCVEEGTGRSSSDSGTARDTKTSRSKKKKKGEQRNQPCSHRGQGERRRLLGREYSAQVHRVGVREQVRVVIGSWMLRGGEEGRGVKATS